LEISKLRKRNSFLFSFKFCTIINAVLDGAIFHFLLFWANISNDFEKSFFIKRPQRQRQNYTHTEEPLCIAEKGYKNKTSTDKLYIL
jgi:hypothetical protein